MHRNQRQEQNKRQAPWCTTRLTAHGATGYHEHGAADHEQGIRPVHILQVKSRLARPRKHKTSQPYPNGQLQSTSWLQQTAAESTTPKTRSVSKSAAELFNLGHRLKVPRTSSLPCTRSERTIGPFPTQQKEIECAQMSSSVASSGHLRTGSSLPDVKLLLPQRQSQGMFLRIASTGVKSPASTMLERSAPDRSRAVDRIHYLTTWFPPGTHSSY
jgi:hypothetical protein